MKTANDFRHKTLSTKKITKHNRVTANKKTIQQASPRLLPYNRRKIISVRGKNGSETKKLDYEAAVKELEALVERLEEGDISLEESLKLYERGVLLTRDCQESLQAAEQKVQMLLQQSGQNNLVDFDPETGDA
ncbi:exodeoxyribonuclease VII small subunit [Methylophaga thalassica]|uniref:exodeoxyribonuclease VII small subunit n=1 Tax=Methylophaga thalassica TaxID=40223 RepID=UPI00360D8258